jgi:hypothetical protein
VVRERAIDRLVVTAPDRLCQGRRATMCTRWCCWRNWSAWGAR